MNRTDEERPDVIELGVATEATRGSWGIYSDEVLMRHMPGLSDD